MIEDLLALGVIIAGFVLGGIVGGMLAILAVIIIAIYNS